LDAYRFTKYLDGAGKKETGTLDKDNILEAIDAASVHMNGMDVPENRLLFINQDLELLFRKALNRVWANDAVINTRITSYNGMEIVYVPSKRFKTVIELLPGEDDQWGYKAGTGSKDINFLLMEPGCVVQASKTAKGKFISADNNPNVDSHQFCFRVFHDAFVIEPLKDGVYASVKG
jgi:hypothetical protein